MKAMAAASGVIASTAPSKVAASMKGMPSRGRTRAQIVSSRVKSHQESGRARRKTSRARVAWWRAISPAGAASMGTAGSGMDSDVGAGARKFGGRVYYGAGAAAVGVGAVVAGARG
jgi:hypothetical protein